MGAADHFHAGKRGERITDNFAVQHGVIHDHDPQRLAMNHRCKVLIKKWKRRDAWDIVALPPDALVVIFEHFLNIQDADEALFGFEYAFEKFAL